MKSLEDYLFDKFGLNSLALARLFWSNDSRVRARVESPEVLIPELQRRYLSGTLSEEAIKRLVQKRNASWNLGSRGEANNAAVNLYSKTPTTYKIAKRIFYLDRPTIESYLDQSLNLRWSLDDLSREEPLFFGQILVRLNQLYELSVETIELLEKRKLKKIAAANRRKQHLECLELARNHSSSVTKQKILDAYFVEEVTSRLQANVSELVSRKKTETDFVVLMTGIPFGYRVFHLAVRYQHFLFVGYDRRLFKDILWEILFESPRVFAELFWHANLWWSLEKSDRSGIDLQFLLFDFYWPNTNRKMFWSVVNQGDWSEMDLIRAQPWEATSEIRLRKLDELAQDEELWFDTFWELSHSKNVQRHFDAHTKTRGKTWDDELRWRG